jgi:hypothetical protein
MERDHWAGQKGSDLYFIVFHTQAGLEVARFPWSAIA